MCRFLGLASEKCDWPSVLQCFGTTAEREGWYRPRKLPFVEPTSTVAPGPGSYSAAESSFRPQMRKRLTLEPIAFDSTDTRPCLGIRSPVTRRAEPGPSDYDLTGLSLANMIKKKYIYSSRKV
mmetsp:Transcript_27234/g.83941  ORF Transcript_27234/g.83941 Transcript_27234/m.83941 type:complete len:123 (-) Transcript_27234:564-932(-)